MRQREDRKTTQQESCEVNWVTDMILKRKLGIYNTLERHKSELNWTEPETWVKTEEFVGKVTLIGVISDVDENKSKE